MTLPSGTRLGAYQIAAPLGAGGMGEVYLARDARLGRDVAIKVLPQDVAADASRLKRFEKEARAASALNHPNIVTIYETGSAEGVSFIAMEKVDGRTLRELLFSGPLALKRLLLIAAQMADGLARAHEAGIVHRDLKPENVMVTKDGLVKILDFGLARQTRVDRGSGEGSHLLTETGTSPGAVLGTVGYMSPEQAAGQAIDFRSDQFAFGSILYEMATGRRAFQKKTAVDTLSAILNEEPEPVSRVNPDAPAPLRWLVERCLAKEPAERYASTRDLARDVASMRDHISELPRGSEGALAAPGRRKSRVVPLVFAGAIVVAALAGWFARATSRKLSAASFHRVAFRRGIVGSARFAPDGQTIVYGQGDVLYSTRLGSPESRAYDFPDSADILSISSSGEMAIALHLRPLPGVDSPVGLLARVPFTGGVPRPVLEGVRDDGADWAPDGKDLVVVRNVNGRDQLEYPIGRAIYSTAGVLEYPRFSPRGDWIVFFEHAPGYRGSGGELVSVIDPSGKHRKVISSSWPSNIGEPSWTPDGKEIWLTPYVEGAPSAIYALDLSGRSRLLTRVPGYLELDDISPQGRVLVAHHTVIFFMFEAGAGDARDHDLSWLDGSDPADLSSDGKTLVFTEDGEANRGVPAVYLRKTDGSPAVRLGDGWALALSPDGKWVLASIMPAGGGVPRIDLLPTGPGQAKTAVSAGFTSFGTAAWFPDGSRFVFSGKEPGHRSRIYAQDLAGGRPRPLVPEGVWIPGTTNPMSPDGKSLLCFKEDGTASVYPLDGGEPRLVPGLAKEDQPIRWSVDDHSIYVLRGKLPAREIWLLDVRSGQRRLWKEIRPPEPDAREIHVVMTADGRSYAYQTSRLFSELYVVDGLK